MAARQRTGIAFCPCGEKTISALLDGTIVTLDRLPDQQGLVAATCDVSGTWRAERHTPGTAVPVTYHPYAVHTCGAETAAEPPAGVSQLDTWREAASGHAARQRNGSRQRRQAPAAGYRTYPGGQR